MQLKSPFSKLKVGDMGMKQKPFSFFTLNNIKQVIMKYCLDIFIITVDNIS